MPWSSGDSSKHKAGLSPEQSKKWASVANATLEYYLKKGASRKQAEALAIRTANSKVKSRTQG